MSDVLVAARYIHDGALPDAAGLAWDATAGERPNWGLVTR
jgi:hypothetical protein